MSTVAGAWPGLPAAGEVFDVKVGPFPHAPFLEAWLETIGAGNPGTIRSGTNLLPVVESSGRVTIAGSADVTDYHSPIGDDPAALAPGISELLEHARSIELDSLPGEGARALATGLSDLGLSPKLSEHDATLVLTIDSRGHLAQLSKKQRHESRRKRRRLVEELGAPQLSIESDDTRRFDQFVAMHRRGEGEKGAFMTAEMEAFFASLFTQPGWEIATLEAGGKALATLFGYRDPDCYYLYNSAYDPQWWEVSPGAVALAELIQTLADQGIMRFDFLKGREPYKFRLGATVRRLYRIDLS